MASPHRFYLPVADTDAATLRLTAREAHHALDVLRLGRGDAVTVLDGVGNIFTCEISSTSRAAVELAVKEKQFTPALSGAVTLLTAIPKGKIETIIEKATELGVTRVVPLLTERTVVKIDAASAADKVEKWRQVAIEAIKQCGSPWLPQIESPLTPAQFLACGEPFDLPLVASLQPDSTDARVAFQNFAATHRRPPQSVCLWIGPEGDFSPAEYALLHAAGIAPITLGALVLRADTAAIAGLAVLRHELRG
ncbi:MAG: Ribosomal small subunit methyltransferase [Verrucomicrobiota bacterium]|jgi:16S rRNA (uracil1498-N3)-methyltransferase